MTWPPVEIDQLWECPVCGAQMGMGSPGRLSPPTCRLAHEATEMEQKNVEAWNTWEEVDRG